MKPFYFDEHDMMSYNMGGEPWFRDKDVDTILEYTDTSQTMHLN